MGGIMNRQDRHYEIFILIALPIVAIVLLVGNLLHLL